MGVTACVGVHGCVTGLAAVVGARGVRSDSMIAGKVGPAAVWFSGKLIENRSRNE